MVKLDKKIQHCRAKNNNKNNNESIPKTAIHYVTRGQKVLHINTISFQSICNTFFYVKSFWLQNVFSNFRVSNFLVLLRRSFIDRTLANKTHDLKFELKSIENKEIINKATFYQNIQDFSEIDLIPWIEVIL